MSAPRRELALDLVAPLAAPGVRILPIVHDSVECAAVVRAVLVQLDPAGVAVELPRSLAVAVDRAIARLPRVTLVVSEEPGEDALVWVAAPGEPFAEALRWAQEQGRARFLVDPDLPYGERHRDPVPDPYAVWSLGAEGYLKSLADACAGGGEEDAAREAGMAYHVREASATLAGGELLVVVGAAHANAVGLRLAGPLAAPLGRVRRASTELAHLHPESLTAVFPEPPLVHALWERRRDGSLPEPTEFDRTVAPRVVLERHGLRLVAGASGRERGERSAAVVDFAARHAARPLVAGLAAPDRWALGRVAWKIAAASYREQTEGQVAPWQRRLFFDFARRYARVEGRLVPGLYEWTVAGRGVGDDNLAWELFDVLRAYPWQSDEAELPLARIDGDELDLGSRQVRFRRRFLRSKSRPVPVSARQRRGDDPESWLRGFTGAGLCSYPPEDLVVEDYGRYLASKAVSLLSTERERSEPFTGSFLDGIDLRETLRHLADDRRVRVRELGRVPGATGSVVVIFDRDEQDERFPFRMTWHGEHHQESDMAFYATDPAAQVVGPGILRATYGGFLLVHPPGRLWDVWSDPDYRFTRDKGEALLAAAIDYSLGALIVHVGGRRPSEAMRQRAALQAKRILHVPLGALSPATLRRVRVVHLLAGHDKRSIARDYIW